MDDPTPDRDNRGRFAPGNPGGPGRRPGYREQLRRAADEAVTPEHIAALMRRALRAGLEGNLSAAKFVIERVCGKAADAPGETGLVPIQLPELRTAADCDAALSMLTKEICAGTCDTVAVRLLIDTVQARLKAIEARDLEVRIAELERAAANVVMPKKVRG